ncbi:hypothetical protein BDR03DRAFT_72133 [Suillus americanus]|nr:hypothetical protein BDR03DRAFT_72133 [Suillus americanus]
MRGHILLLQWRPKTSNGLACCIQDRAMIYNVLTQIWWVMSCLTTCLLLCLQLEVFFPDRKCCSLLFSRSQGLLARADTHLPRQIYTIISLRYTY